MPTATLCACESAHNSPTEMPITALSPLAKFALRFQQGAVADTGKSLDGPIEIGDKEHHKREGHRDREVFGR